MVIVSGMERMTFEVLRALKESKAEVHCILNDWENHRIRELVDSIQEGRPPLGPPEVDLHLLDIVAAVGRAAVTGREQGVASQPAIPDLTYDPPRGHAHDRTRPIGQQ